MLVVSGQTLLALGNPDEPAPIQRGFLARILLGAVAGLTGVLAVDLVPAIAAVLGIALIPLAVLSRVYIYRRVTAS